MIGVLVYPMFLIGTTACLAWGLDDFTPAEADDPDSGREVLQPLSTDPDTRTAANNNSFLEIKALDMARIHQSHLEKATDISDGLTYRVRIDPKAEGR